MSAQKLCHVYGCRYSTFHITEGHKCGKCGEHGHGRYECGDPVKITSLKQAVPIYSEIEQAVINVAKKALGSNIAKCYVVIYGGMGCTWYARRNGLDCPISIFFMHSDSWGQYGPSSDDRPKLEAFINGYREIVQDTMPVVE